MDSLAAAQRTPEDGIAPDDSGTPTPTPPPPQGGHNEAASRLHACRTIRLAVPVCLTFLALSAPAWAQTPGSKDIVATTGTLTPSGYFSAAQNPSGSDPQPIRTEATTGRLKHTDTDALPATGGVALIPLCTGSKTGSACWLEVKNKPGCHVWNTNPKPDETVTWTGQCADGKLSGKGRATWRFREDGAWASSYEEGPFVDGKSSDGHWVARFADADGEVWEGSLSKGVLNGLWVRRGSFGQDWTCMVGGENSSDIGKCGIEEVDHGARAKRRAELRSGPSPYYERIGTVASGDRVRVTGEAERKWARIETADGIGGFVLASTLAKAESGKEAPKGGDQARYSETVWVARRWSWCRQVRS